jgi:hypothetical protein
MNRLTHAQKAELLYLLKCWFLDIEKQLTMESEYE